MHDLTFEIFCPWKFGEVREGVHSGTDDCIVEFVVLNFAILLVLDVPSRSIIFHVLNF